MDKTTDGFSNNAIWITCPTQKKPVLGGSPATYFRKTISVSENIFPATITVAALGLFALFVNGKKANKDVLAAPFTNYNKTILYHTYDIASFLRRGTNRIEIVVGDGWCNQNTTDEWGFFRSTWKTINKMICTIQIGNEEIISDESWEVCQDGPIYRSALRLGEFHNNNLTPSYSSFAQKCDPPRGKLKKDAMHAILECKKIKPKSIATYKEGFLLDFGQNIAGYLGFIINGYAGQTITITYGDKLTNGQIDNDFNARYITDETLRHYFQVDKITLSKGKNRYKPLFSYHGFRYAFAEGLSTEQPEKLAAFAIRTSFPKTGEFTSSSKRLTRLQKMCVASTEANFVGIPTDCPHREKNGWTGDVQLSLEQMMYNFDCAIDIKKYLADICDCQSENGCIPCIVPTTENIFGYDWGNGPVWDLALFEIPYRLALLKNDFDTAKQYFPHLEKYYAYLKTRRSDDGLYEFGLGDWSAPQDLPTDLTPLSLVASLSVLQMTRIMEFFYNELFGSDGGYAKEELSLTKAIRHKFIQIDGTVATNSICALASVLYYGIANDEEKPVIFDNLLKALCNCNYTMQFGILGNKYLYRVLCEYDRADLALKILENNRYPSFGYWIKQGAVTLWEDFKGIGSRNHYMFSDISAVFYKYFAGISYEFRHDVQYNTIRLINLPKIKSIHAKLSTPNGILQIEKKLTNARVEYDVILPDNSITTVIYPNGNKEILAENIAQYKIVL